MTVNANNGPAKGNFTPETSVITGFLEHRLFVIRPVRANLGTILLVCAGDFNGCNSSSQPS